MRNITKHEVAKADLEKYVAEHPGKPLKFDGMRWTMPVKMNGLVWNKPVAYTHEGKFFVIEDV